ncbi:MAG: RluA family pseudouridine synthase [Oscillospiraceae bacterium]|nr:RluA family pseudouridine synthase [Oscillospiraceae bacterium]
MHSFTIQQNDAGQRLDAFFRKVAPHLPSSLLYKALRTKKIKCNGKRAAGSLRLQAGDTLTCYLPDELFAPPKYQYAFFRAGKALDALYEDAHILLANKPAGLLSHPDEGEYCDTLLGRIQRYLYETGCYDPARENTFAPALVNRIDRNTEGIVIAAKTAAALRVLNEKMKNRELRKFYLCAVHGCPKAGEALPGGWRLLRGWLIKRENQSLVEILPAPRPGAKEIQTSYRILAQADGLSLLEIELRTGRTHQIRAQFAAAGHALVGDGKYAPRAQFNACGYKKQCLASARLVFAFDGDAGELEYLRGLDIQLPKVGFVLDIFGLEIAKAMKKQ